MRRVALFCLIILGLSVGTFATPARAAEITFGVANDVTVQFAQPDQSFNGQTLDALYNSGTDILNAPVDVKESYFRFDISTVPKDKFIESAKLIVTASGGSDAGYADVRIRRVTAPWGDGITWNSKPAYSTESEANLEITNNVWPAEIDLTNVVRDWYSGAQANNGLMMRAFGDGDYKKGIYSAQDAHIFSKEGSKPPQLVVTYGPTPPSPSPTPVASATPISGASSPSSQPSSTDGSATDVSGGTTPEQKIQSCLTDVQNLIVKASVSDAVVSFTSTAPTLAKVYAYTGSKTTPPRAANKQAAGFEGGSTVAQDTVGAAKHQLTLGFLQPNTTYFFTLINGDKQDCEHQFKMPATSSDTLVAGAQKNPGALSGLGAKKARNSHGTIDVPQGLSVALKSAYRVITGGQPVPLTTTTAFLAGLVMVFLLGYTSLDRGKRIYTALLNIPNWWFALRNSDRKKRRGTWGKVISSVGMEGIPRAVLSLYDADTKKLVDRTSSDVFGFYGFFAPAGSYYVTVVHGAFSFPTAIMPFAYRGDAFKIENASGTTHLDLPVDPAELSNERLQKLERGLINIEVARIPLLLLGTTLSVIALASILSPLHVALLAYYLYLWYREWQHRREAKYVLQLKNKANEPIPLALVQLKNRYGRIVFRKITDSHGRMSVVIREGDYALEILTFAKGEVQKADEQAVSLKRGIFLKQLPITLN